MARPATPALFGTSTLASSVLDDLGGPPAVPASEAGEASVAELAADLSFAPAAPTAAPPAPLASAPATAATDEVSPFAAITEPPAIATITDTETAEVPSDDDFVFARPPSGVRNLIATVTGSRRNIAIAVAGGGLLVLVSAFAFCGGGSSGTNNQVASNKTASTANTASGAKATAVEAEPAPEPVEKTAPSGSGDAPSDPGATSDPSGPTPEELAAAAADSGEPAPAPATAEPGKPANPATAAPEKPAPKKATIGGKQVVLEYDTQARDTKRVASAPKSDQGAIQKARAAYASGNQRLFAGDPAGAIRFYRQSLGHYPGYVAGYRGLGLAYAQQKDKANALRALRMYVSSVPTAKDVPLIRKRIKTLEGK